MSRAKRLFFGPPPAFMEKLFDLRRGVMLGKGGIDNPFDRGLDGAESTLLRGEAVPLGSGGPGGGAGTLAPPSACSSASWCVVTISSGTSTVGAEEDTSTCAGF